MSSQLIFDIFFRMFVRSFAIDPKMLHSRHMPKLYIKGVGSYSIFKLDLRLALDPNNVFFFWEICNKYIWLAVRVYIILSLNLTPEPFNSLPFLIVLLLYENAFVWKRLKLKKKTMEVKVAKLQYCCFYILLCSQNVNYFLFGYFCSDFTLFKNYKYVFKNLVFTFLTRHNNLAVWMGPELWFWFRW